jgi:hypothetical protein
MFIIIYVYLNFDFNIDNVHIKEHMLICHSYPCMWIEEKSEVVMHGRGRYVVTQTNKQMTKKLKYTIPVLIYQS